MSCDPCNPSSPEPIRFLADYLMPLGTTGIVFVAQLSATLRLWGPEFSDADKHSAELRAGAVLSQTAMVRGQSLRFLRLAAPLTEAEAADLMGTDVPTLQSWEAETVETPHAAWVTLAHHVAALDGCYPFNNLPSCPKENWIPRKIRVYPEFPTISTQVASPLCDGFLVAPL